tara:strand:- start:18151 stop:18927 length:777 start_codon:yes stop_codon:yes gene_type:complete
MTPIDTAHAHMEANPNDDNARLGFYERLMDGEMFMLLETESDGQNIKPDLFTVDDQTYALIFDREERLAEFAEKIVPFAAFSGRTVVAMLDGQNIGLGINLAVSSSSTLLPPSAITWMAQTVATAPTQAEAKPSEIFAPAKLPETFLTALDAKLSTMAGLADIAYLAQASYETGIRASVIAFVNARPDAQSAIARAISETLIFSGIEAGSLDVMFLNASDAICAKFAKMGLRFDLPKLETPTAPSAPGMDPDKPPKLR